MAPDHGGTHGIRYQVRGTRGRGRTVTLGTLWYLWLFAWPPACPHREAYARLPTESGRILHLKMCQYLMLD